MTDNPVPPVYAARHSHGAAATSTQSADYQPAYYQPAGYAGPPSSAYSGPPVTSAPPTYAPTPYGPPAYPVAAPYASGAAVGFPPPQPFWPATGPNAPGLGLLSPPRPRIRRGFLVAGIVAALALVSGGVTWAVKTAAPSSSSAGPTHTLSMPTSFGTYTLQSDQTALQTADDIRSEMVSSQPAYADGYSHALVGIYTPSAASTHRLIVIGFSASQSSSTSNELKNSSPASIIDGIMLGAKVPDATSFDTGALRGALRCGNLSVSGTSIPVCAWADNSTVAVVVDAADVNVQAAAATTLALRNSAEH